MTTAVPTRHPEEACDVPPGIRIFAALLGLRGPTPQYLRELGTLLTVGDEPADTLVEWMYDAGMATSRPLFEQALTQGISSVPDAPEPLRTFFSEVERIPEWVDWDRIALGSLAMRSGGCDGLYIARDVALLGGYMFAGFNQTLLRTGALEKGSNKRFAETAQWAIDCIGDDAMRPGGTGYCSTLRVRLIHSMVRRHVMAMQDWDAQAWGLPINQTDMAATLVGALISPVMGTLGLGAFLRPREYDAASHLARYVGHLMGVQEQFLPKSFRDGVRILYHTSAALSTPDETSKKLGMPMIDDPLVWHYPAMTGPRRKLARSQHLSISGTFLGPSAMRTLGLPSRNLPWYPLVRFPVNLVRSVAALRQGGRERAAERGMTQQHRFLRTLLPSEATIGESAAQITGHRS